MPTFFRSQVVLHRDGATPADDAVNVMHWEGDEQVDIESYRDDWDTQVDGLITRIYTLYQTLGAHLSSVLSGNGTIKMYDMRDPLPRAPREISTFTFTPGTTALPSECAAVVTFRAEPASGVIAARRRGRIFLGPLSQAGLEQPAGYSDVILKTSARTGIADAFGVAALGGGGAARLAIFSPTQAGGTTVAQQTSDAAWTDVKTISVDDAYDTVRSRGAKARVVYTKTLVG